jgi:hypothetical protein
MEVWLLPRRCFRDKVCNFRAFLKRCAGENGQAKASISKTSQQREARRTLTDDNFRTVGGALWASTSEVKQPPQPLELVNTVFYRPSNDGTSLFSLLLQGSLFSLRTTASDD